MTNATDQTRPTSAAPVQLVVVSAGVGDPSSTRLLADRLAEEFRGLAAHDQRQVHTETIELRELSGELTTAMVTGVLGEGLTRATALIAAADAVIASAPVYKAQASGLFTSFFQVLERDLFIALPLALGATAGTKRHTLVLDSEMRAQFAYLRALVAPTSVFAASEDWNEPALERRIARAANELWVLVRSGVGHEMRAVGAKSYTIDFGSSTSQSAGVDFDTDLMRLATGGSLPSRE